MNPTPQSLRSPISPYPQAGKSFSQQQQCYPASPQSESMLSKQNSAQGLGLFVSLAPSQNIVSELPPSPQTSENWTQASMMDHDYSQASHILSAAFDPFSGFTAAESTGGMHSIHSPENPGLDYCQTPPRSNTHRSSLSSNYPPSESYSQSESEYAYTPKVKTEEQEWYQASGNEHILQRTLSTNGLPAYPQTASSLASHTEDLYRASEWTKADTAGYITGLHSDGRLPRFDMQPILPSVSRIKKKRQRTTPEEATHECNICGKLFKRSYNYKSHMDTHNPERKYPHPCTAMIGNAPCTKKFQRKTDLDRHHDSVHLKARNHKCSLCGHSFARRDTLRRHTEDGCPKRFEVLGVRSDQGPMSSAMVSSPISTRAWGPPPATPSFPNPTGHAAHPASSSAGGRPRAFSLQHLPGNHGAQSSPMAPPQPPHSAMSAGQFPMYNGPGSATLQSSPTFQAGN
ncbi:hypothetical protein MMC09_004755 [Bachmanniomyces sp. S44760]|nr:hypothetical protein [Bachmanniomyces sp. S44760]